MEPTNNAWQPDQPINPQSGSTPPTNPVPPAVGSYAPQPQLTVPGAVPPMPAWQGPAANAAPTMPSPQSQSQQPLVPTIEPSNGVQPTLPQIVPQANWPAFMRGPSQSVPNPAVQQPPVVSPAPDSNPYQPQSATAGYEFLQSAPVAPRQRRSFMPALMIVLILGLLGGGGAYAYSHLNSQNTPDKVFKAALDKALSTEQQKLTLGASDVSATVLYNLASTSDPRIDEATIMKSAGSLEAESYASKQNTYVTYKDLGSSALNKQNASLLNKWVQLKKNGAAVDGADSLSAATVTAIPDLASSLLGSGWPLGNFAAKDRQSLVDYVLSNQVFKYDAKKVTKDTVGGQSVYVYAITPDKTKLVVFAKKELALWGFSSSEIATAVNEGLAGTTDLKLYISTGSMQILKMTDNSTFGAETATYTYGNINFPGEPKPNISITQLSQALDSGGAGITGDTGGASGAAGTAGGSDSADAVSNDNQREEAVDSLAANIESYAANNNSQYPTTAQMHDNSWIAKNMPDLDPAALKDPEGTSTQLATTPTKHQYSYQAMDGNNALGCNNGTIACLNYQVTAILSDGTQYTQKSL